MCLPFLIFELIIKSPDSSRTAEGPSAGEEYWETNRRTTILKEKEQRSPHSEKSWHKGTWEFFLVRAWHHKKDEKKNATFPEWSEKRRVDHIIVNDRSAPQNQWGLRRPLYLTIQTGSVCSFQNGDYYSQSFRRVLADMEQSVSLSLAWHNKNSQFSTPKCITGSRTFVQNPSGDGRTEVQWST